MFKESDLIKYKKTRSRYMQGHFSPSNPKKYMGDQRHIVYRSSWELKFMIWCDKNPAVINWSSEENIIPYLSPVDNRYHRYFVDFRICVQTKEGKKTYLIEIKPEKQTKAPEKKKKVTKTFVKEVVTFAVNDAKWDAARAYCKLKGWDFMILNEHDLQI